MKSIFTHYIFFSLLLLLSLLPVLFLLLERKKHSYLFELIKKTDDFFNVQKLGFLLADEAKKLFDAKLVCVVEYTYSKSSVLAALPTKLPDKTSFSPHEIFFILKTLIGQKSDFLNENDIQSEHLKQYFPLFDYAAYKIISVYNDDFRIITLELYGEIKKNPSGQILEKVIEIFKKAFFSRIRYQEDLQNVNMNEIIIRFLDRIRYTLDEDELEKIILEEISHSFEADRAFYIISYAENPQKPRIGKEYLANPYAKSMKGNNLDYNSVWVQLKETQMNPPVFVIENSEKFIKQNNLENSPIDIFIKNSRIKSSYPFLLYQNETYSMYLVLQFTRNVRIFDKTDFKIMELLSKQTHIALAQAKLYSDLLLGSREEKLITDLITTLRSSFSIKQIANEFTSKVGIFFEAKRCIVRFFDAQKKEFTGYDEAFEYKRNYDVPGTKNMNLQKELGDFLLNSEKFHDALAISYSHDLCDKEFEYKEDILRYFERYGIKTYLTAFVRYNGKLLGFISLHFDTDFIVKNKQIALIKALSDQLGIAIYQAELYNASENAAKKEKLLKEVFSDTLGFESKEQIYKYFAEKLFGILFSKAIFFAEFENDFPKKYYEYYKDSDFNISEIKDTVFFSDIVSKKDFLYYCNLRAEENEEISSFTDITGVVCIGTIPVNADLLLIFFFDKQREFSPFDKSIMASLVSAIAQTLKDVMQRSKIKALRETFLSTLTHDLQIPVVAQRNAIEYLKGKNLSNEKSQKILDYLSETNEQTEDMIKVLSEIYRYEAGIKNFSKIIFDVYEVADEVLDGFLPEKNIDITKNFYAQKHIIEADKNEVQKILLLLLNYIAERIKSEKITINISDNEKYLKLCLCASEIQISGNLTDIIFERELVATQLERLVGEGIHLYLAKLIAVSQGGNLYFSEKIGNEKEFCLELPLG